MGNDFTSLEVYRLAENFSCSVYLLTRSFPREEIYGLTSQFRRAAVSIALNIAESYGRFSYKEKIVFLYNARGSLLECKSLVFIGFRLDYLSSDDKEEMTTDLDKLGVKINNYLSFLKKRKAGNGRSINNQSTT